MREFTLTVFDENIVGTGPWYTSSQHDDVLGSADTFMVQAITENVSGTTTLAIDSQHSNNGLDWLTLDTGLVGAPTIVNDGTYVGVHAILSGTPPLSLLRFKVSLSGTSPGCRLKLLVCGRRT